MNKHNNQSLEDLVERNIQETLKETKNNYVTLMINKKAIENLHRQASNLDVRLVSFGRSCGNTKRKMKYKCYKTMMFLILILVVILIVLGICSRQ